MKGLLRRVVSLKYDGFVCIWKEGVYLISGVKKVWVML